MRVTVRASPARTPNHHTHALPFPGSQTTPVCTQGSHYSRGTDSSRLSCPSSQLWRCFIYLGQMGKKKKIIIICGEMRQYVAQETERNTQRRLKKKRAVDLITAHKATKQSKPVLQGDTHPHRLMTVS